MIYLLPQLPVKNRYTEDWIKIWRRELMKVGRTFTVLGTDKTAELTNYFTNLLEALKYESKQIKDLCKYKPKKILVLDIDTTGLLGTALLVLKLVNPDLKCYGYLHAGSWCNGDIFSKSKGKKEMEEAYFYVFDKVFVATHYHKNKIQEYFGKRFNNLKVVGFPFYEEDVYKYVKPLPFEKKKGVLVVGRKEQSNLDMIKGVEYLTADNRKEYFEKLNRAKVVLSLKTEETFGLCMLETFVLGGIPLCPNKFSYSEVIPYKSLLYTNKADLKNKLKHLLSLEENHYRINLGRYRNTISCISKQI